jgi:hypothetical protein
MPSSWVSTRPGQLHTRLCDTCVRVKLNGHNPHKERVLHRDLQIWRLAGVALIGALALETVLILSDGLEDAFTVQRIPGHLVALVVGTLIGWMYELLRELNRATELSLQQFTSMRTSIESLTSRIKYQDEALSMLTSCPRHNEALTALLKSTEVAGYSNRA